MRFRPTLQSPSMAVALTALFVALGGTGYAATQVGNARSATPAKAKPKHKTKPLTRSVVTAIFNSLFAKSDDATKDLRELNAYLAATAVPNAKHATNADSATAATNAAHATNADQLGGVGAGAYQQYGATLPSGQTESGEWGAGGDAAGGYPNAGAGARAFPQYPVPLGFAIDGTHAIYVSGATATHCPGAGQADPGYLCVYQTTIQSGNTPNSSTIFNPDAGGSSGAGKYGFSIFLSAFTGGVWYVGGVYSVTAP